MKEFLIFLVVGNAIILAIWSSINRKQRRKDKPTFDERDIYHTSKNGEEKHKKSA
jgi:hypothetical protein